MAYLRETLGIKQAGYRDTLTVRAPDNVESAFFKLPDDGRISIIETRRTAFDEQGTPVRLTVSVYPADRNQFAVNVGDVPAGDRLPVSRGHQRTGRPARRARGCRSGAKHLRPA